jgi:hypothetical protein
MHLSVPLMSDAMHSQYGITRTQNTFTSQGRKAQILYEATELPDTANDSKLSGTSLLRAKKAN